MKHSILLICAVFLSGCASNQFSSDIAKYSSIEDQASPPLLVTSKFNSQLCSRYFGYVNFSVVNPSSDWKRLNNVSLEFPFSSNDQFAVIKGEKLSAWADASSRQQGRNSHNTQMANMAAGIIGLGLIAKGNNTQKKVGAALLTGSAMTSSAQNIVNQREVVETRSSNHILANDAYIPPGMDRQYWLLLTAQDEAPLLGQLNVNYEDENGMKHSFTTQVNGWEDCGWQEYRKAILNKKAAEIAFKAKPNFKEGATRVDSPRGKPAQMSAWKTELYLKHNED